MFGMLSVLAELPRELIVAKTRDGLAAARGRRGGRPAIWGWPGRASTRCTRRWTGSGDAKTVSKKL